MKKKRNKLMELNYDLDLQSWAISITFSFDMFKFRITTIVPAHRGGFAVHRITWGFVERVEVLCLRKTTFS